MKIIKKPLIGITVNTADAIFNEQYDFMRTRYFHAICYQSYVNFVLIPNCSKQAGDLLDRLDGVLFTGGASNIQPELYGGKYILKDGELDGRRDSTVMELLAKADKLGMPIMGICRGFQEMNVYRGGTLKGDVSLEENNFEHIKYFDTGLHDFNERHDINICKGSKLLEINNGIGVVKINSVHGQAIDKLGDGVTVEASSTTDGIVEAISYDDYPSFAIGVQWHPESEEVFKTGINAKLFKAFATSCDRYMNNSVLEVI